MLKIFKEIKKLREENSNLKKEVELYKNSLKDQVEEDITLEKEFLSAKEELAKLIEEKDAALYDLHELKEHYRQFDDIYMPLKHFIPFILDKYMNDKMEELYTTLSSLDDEGFIEYMIVCKLIPCDIYSEYYYESNLGYFEEMSGYRLSRYHEMSAFGEKEYEIVSSCHERLSNCSDYSQDEKFLEYRKELKKQTILAIANEKPVETFKILYSFSEKLDKKS